MNRVFYIMGVSGSGKTTVGIALAKVLSLPFYDGDDFHPESNIRKMTSGQALTDTDRYPWLEKINLFVKEKLIDNSLIVACSALKHSYREVLVDGIQNKAKFIFLQGSFNEIQARMVSRSHFMPATLLQSQFDTLEVPNDALRVDIRMTVKGIVEYIISSLEMKKADIGLIGLGVMGTNLARNIARNGFSISLYNRRVEEKEEEVARKAIDKFDEFKVAYGFEDLTQFVNSLEKPRKIILMITAGEPVDRVINKLIPLLSPGDTVVDGGNSFYKDTQRRIKELTAKKIQWIGAGISGGEEGALMGPSIMPGGSDEGLNNVLPFLKIISAKSEDGLDCCARVGSGASGHFVKMVHNGIEYAEMQLIAEVYDLLKNYNALDNKAIANIFQGWNQGETASYLLEISIDILRKKTKEGFLLDEVLDVAASKGTGSWTTQVAAELGVAIPNLTAALNARYISMQFDKRKNQSLLPKPSRGNIEIKSNELLQTYQFCRWINHIQGFDLIDAASEKYKWNVDRTVLAKIWLNGCIIRSELMNQIASSDEKTLLRDIREADLLNRYGYGIKLLSKYIDGYIALPIIENSISYFKSIRRADSPANLIQAQRDYFGAHTYKKKDDPYGPSHHSEWAKS